MTALTRTVLGLLALTVLAAIAGGWLGVRYGLAQARATNSLDQRLHRELDLSTSQQRQLAVLEATFASRRKALESQARAANRELAAAILSEHRYGPRAAQAVDHFYTAMSTLQRETILHVLAMRSVLSPEQATQFDRIIAQTLDSDRL